MLFRALALFLVLNSVFLATESQISFGEQDKNCVVIKNIYGEYLTVKDKDPERKLVLESDFQKRSLFRLMDRKVRGRTVYRIESCYNDQAVSWARIDHFKLIDDNYFAFANNFERVKEFNTWMLKFESDDTFVQILDAESGGQFNLFSAWTTDEDGNPLALVYGQTWPSRDASQEEKVFWTIEDPPDHRGIFEKTFGRAKRPSSGQPKRPRPPNSKPSKPSFVDKPSKPSFVDFNRFDGKPGKPGSNVFDDSPILDAEKEVDDHNTNKKPLVDEDEDEETDHEDQEDHKDHEEEEQHKEEEEEVLAAEIKPKSKPKEPCYILKQQFRGLTYTMGLDTQGGQRRTNVIMEQGSSRSSENAWRFIPESDRTFSSKYKIQNCKTDDILSVSYKQSSKSDNRDSEVFVVDENQISKDDIQVWSVDERNDNKILISDASKPSFYLSVTSNPKNSKIRDVVSIRQDDTNSQSIVFIFDEFKI